MKVKKVIKAAVLFLTNIKGEILNYEYDALQSYLHENEEADLYSANKQQAKRFYKKIKEDKEYPLSIRKDLLKIEKRDTKIAKYWARIPVKGRRGGIWIAIKPHCNFPDEFEICESKLIRKDDRFYLNITIQKDVEVEYPSNPSVIIACDVGEANPLASVVWEDGSIEEVHFGAPQVRGIRTHYKQVRKEIGHKKVKHGLEVIKKIGNAEQRKVSDTIHKATREVVDKAKELKEKGKDVLIVVGNVKNVRKKRKKYKSRCKKNNRKIHSMPSYMVKSQLKYKAEWEGIPVEFINEAYTSQLCWRCGERGKRNKRHFLCQNCGLDYNADLNAAKNILNRSLGYMLRDRVSVNMPLSSTANYTPDEGDIKRSQKAMEEATQLVGW